MRARVGQGGGGANTGSSTAGGGPVFCAVPSPARESRGAVPSGNLDTRMTRKRSAPRPSVTGTWTLQLIAPVEPRLQRWFP